MPMTLAQRCIALTSKPADVVLDPYAGSGTTLIAAARLRRQWVGIELKPEFVSLIDRRNGGMNDRQPLKVSACTVHAEWRLVESSSVTPVEARKREAARRPVPGTPPARLTDVQGV